MAIMTKRGNLDNIVTYEHICDTYEDLQNIDPKYATLGSTAIVINQEEGLNAYMATSAGEWVSIAAANGGGSDSGGGITPTGTYNITANGTYNVTRYATAKVNVPNEGIIPSGTYNVTKNGVYNVESYLSVNVKVPEKETILSTNKVLIPDNITKTVLSEDDWFDGYKKVTVTPKNIDITSHKKVQPNDSTQYVYGDDLIIIPTGVSSGKTTAGEDVILQFNTTMDDLSCYYLRSGSLHTINNANDSEIYELDIELTPQYITPNMSIYGEGESNVNTIYIKNNLLYITTLYKTYVLTEVTITSPIILEKVCNLTSLYDIELNDGSPDLHPYQLDTTKISLVDGNLYALYCKTSTAGSAITQVLFSFIPFMWDSVNGFVSGYFTSTPYASNPLNYPKIQITPDYKLNIQQSDIYRPYGKISICSLDFNNIKNYLDYVTVKPITLQEKIVTPTEETQIIQPQNTSTLATLPVGTSAYGTTVQYDLNFTPQTYHKYNIHGQLMCNHGASTPLTDTITIDIDNFLFLENQPIPYTSSLGNISKIVFSNNYLIIYFSVSGWYRTEISSELTITEDNCSEIIRTESSRIQKFEANFENTPLVIGKTYSVHANASSNEGQTVTKNETITEDFVWDGIKKNITTEYYQVEITSNSIIFSPLYESHNGIKGGLVLLEKNKDYGLSKVTINPIPSNYVQKTNFTIYFDGVTAPSIYATAASETNLSYHSLTNTLTSYWITGNELTLFTEITFDFTNDSTGVTLKSLDTNTGIAILTITDGAIIGVQLQPK